MLAALTFSLSVLTLPSQATLTDCIELPAPPLNGKLSYVGGTLTARLKCADPRTDLTGAAPGFQGALICDPREKEFDFDHVSRQTCLPYVAPIQLRSEVEVFRLWKSKCTKMLEDTFKKILEAQLIAMEVPKKYYWSPIKITCDDVNIIDHDNQTTIMATFFWLTAGFDPETPYEELREFHRFIDKKMAFQQNFGTWQHYYMYKWQAVCDKKSLVGTYPFYTGRYSCRGCPSRMFMDVYHYCAWCVPGTYTPSNFADACVDCPPKEDWKDEKDYLYNCVIRH